ncbi:MAG: hypothetical protein KJO25_05690 [Bacteroidia bacterium]|nr:hypothetical protein [Bacteroidia bacterium]
MDDRTTFYATWVLTLFFLVCGILDILENPVIQALLFLGFAAIILQIVRIKSKDRNKKNLPD